MREKLHRILDLVLDLNEQGDSFMQISGHVKSVSVQINDGKWDASKELLNRYEYYDREVDDEEDAQNVEQYTLEKLDKLINSLEKLKGESK